jgi:hypothetical protein
MRISSKRLHFVLLIFLAFPLSGICQIGASRAFIQKEAEYPEYVHYTLKIFPSKFDTSYKIELVQSDSAGNEVILSSPMLNISTVVYKKGFKMESGKVYESLYTAIKKNDKWNDEYINIRDCSGSKYLEGAIKLKRNENYTLRIFNQDKKFFEEKTDLR